MPEALFMIFLLDSEGTKASQSCRSRKVLQNGDFLANIGFDTAQKKSSNVCYKILLVKSTKLDFLIEGPGRKDHPRGASDSPDPAAESRQDRQDHEAPPALRDAEPRRGRGGAEDLLHASDVQPLARVRPSFDSDGSPSDCSSN